MNVRKIVKTTISVVIIIIGFAFFRIYFTELLSKLLDRIYRSEIELDLNGESVELVELNELGELDELGETDAGSKSVYFHIITEKLKPINNIGGYFPAVFYICIIIILAARVIDAIINHKYAFNVLSSFIQPIIMTVIVTIALSINRLNILQLWAILYFILLISLHTTFKKIVVLTESAGSYADLKLFKNFVLTVKKTAENAVSLGFKGFNKPVDEVSALSASCVLLFFEAVVLISFIIYMLTHWRLIFLSHIIQI